MARDFAMFRIAATGERSAAPFFSTTGGKRGLAKEGGVMARVCMGCEIGR